MNSKLRKSWFGRNWPWFLPVAVLSSVLLLLAFVGLIQALSFGKAKQSLLYKDAAAFVRDSDEVAKVFGPEVEIGVQVARKVERLELGNRIELSFPVFGADIAGRVNVVAVEQGEHTRIQEFEIEVDGGDATLDLLRGQFFDQ